MHPWISEKYKCIDVKKNESNDIELKRCPTVEQSRS
jgi:hypothetical protein